MAERNQVYCDLVYGEWGRFAAGLTDEERRTRLEGIQYEVDTITRTHMADYFLLNHAIVKLAKNTVRGREDALAKKRGDVITVTERGPLTSMVIRRSNSATWRTICGI